MGTFTGGRPATRPVSGDIVEITTRGIKSLNGDNDIYEKACKLADELCESEIWRHRSQKISFSWNCDIFAQKFTLLLKIITTRSFITTIYFLHLPFLDVKNVKIPPHTSPTPRQRRPERYCSECWLCFFATANQRMRQNESRNPNTVLLNQNKLKSLKFWFDNFINTFNIIYIFLFY